MQQPGSMMDRPLLVSAILEHGENQYGDQQIVSRDTDGSLHRYRFADLARRARQLANALQALGLRPGSVVGSLAWNNHRHLEAYYAVSGSGMVMHTCNPRLHPEQLAYIVNHADDEVVLFDTTFAPLVRAIAASCPRVRHWVALCDADALSALDLQGVPAVDAYETLVARQTDTFAWPECDEKSGAALCYTSGTTGNPKGVLYSHRALALSALSACMWSAQHQRAGDHPARGPHVPHQRLVPALRSADRRCQAGAARPAPGCREPVRVDGDRARHRQRRRAHHLDGPHPAC